MKEKFNSNIPNTHESSNLEPVLVNHFMDIRENPNLNPRVEEFNSIFIDDEYRKHIFEEANKTFAFVFKKNEFLNHLQKEPNKESRKYLRMIRRYGLVLRAIYQFLYPKHKCPDELHTFISTLGKFNDKYLTTPLEIERNEIFLAIDKIELPIESVDVLDFKNHVLKILNKIEKLFNKEKINVDELHTLRKSIRLFADLMQIPAAEDYKGNNHWLFYSIVEISSAIDKDLKVEQQVIEEVDYKKILVEPNKIIKDNFKYIKPYIEKVCGV